MPYRAYVGIVIFITLVLLIPIIISLDDIFVKLTFFSFGIIIPLLMLIISNYKLTIKKDIINNTVQIKLLNFMCFPKLKFDCHIKDISFSTQSFRRNDSDTSRNCVLIIYNSNKNYLELNENKIKTKPVNFYYYYDDIAYEENETENAFRDRINRFICPEYNYSENDFNYESKNKEVVPNRLFIHNLIGLNEMTCFDIFILFITSFLNYIGLCYLLFRFIEEKEFNSNIMVIYYIPTYNIILYIIYKCFKKFKENVVRIDCMYSKNFDKIFIGLVKYTKTSYAKTFEYEINNIEKFTLIKEGKNFNLKVELKKKGIEHIYTIKKRTEEDLEELISFLNRRLINNSI